MAVERTVGFYGVLFVLWGFTVIFALHNVLDPFGIEGYKVRDTVYKRT